MFVHARTAPPIARKHLKALFIALLAAIIITAGHVLYFNVNADPRLIAQPWLLNNGFIQYEHIADEHAPLLPQLLAWFMPLFANDALLTLRVVHGLSVGSSVFLTTFWVYEKNGRWAVLATSIFFWKWSLSFGYWGMWYELALSPIYFLIFIILIHKTQQKSNLKTFILGVLTGIAILIKQHAVLLVVVCLAWILWETFIANTRWRFLLRLYRGYLLGLLFPVMAYVLYYFSLGGTLSALLYWPLIFNLEGNYNVIGQVLPNSANMFQMLPAFIMLIPFIVSIIKPIPDTKPDPPTRILLLTFWLASLVFLYPRYSIPHWATSLPFFAAFSGIASADIIAQGQRTNANKAMQWSVYATIIAVWLLQGVTIHWPYWQGNKTQTFPKYSHLVNLANTLEDRLPPGDEIVLLPDNEAVGNLYYYLQRTPPHFWIMYYPWFTTPETNAKWIETVDTEKPQTLLFFGPPTPLENNAPDILAYVQENYEVIDSVTWEKGTVQIMIRRER